SAGVDGPHGRELPLEPLVLFLLLLSWEPLAVVAIKRVNVQAIASAAGTPNVGAHRLPLEEISLPLPILRPPQGRRDCAAFVAAQLCCAPRARQGRLRLPHQGPSLRLLEARRQDEEPALPHPWKLGPVEAVAGLKDQRHGVSAAAEGFQAVGREHGLDAALCL